MLECGFFNAVNKDRTYNADDFNTFFDGILSETGVYKKNGGRMKVVPNEGMTVNVLTGKARILSHWVNISIAENVTIPLSDMLLARYDAIALRYDIEKRDVKLIVIVGEPSENPEKPQIERDLKWYDICLAYVYVAAGATNITEKDIIDTRDDNYLCGYVKLQIDGINAGIKEYKNTVDTTKNIDDIYIGIPEYDADNDLLYININGIMLNEDEDYTKESTGSDAKVNFTKTIDVNNRIEFRVLKSVVEVK